MNYENILVEIEEHIGVIKFNRPEIRNALDAQTLLEISHALEAIENDEECRRHRFYRERGKIICCWSRYQTIKRKAAIRCIVPGMSGVYRKIENCTKATIAAVNGYALGGDVN